VILRDELLNVMANLGAPSVAEMAPDLVRWSFPTQP
jgi:hypothetical protein